MTTNTSSFANTNRSGNLVAPNGQVSSNSNENNNNSNNEEDQLNRINLQTLQNRDPYISKIVDQAQRVCVYKFVAEKREWERKDLEGTLFVYERLCKPYHGFAILSTVSRETFVQIIKSSMEFKHTPTYEAFLQYKVDVGDIYGIWFISKNDCPRVTECLKCLTEKAKEYEQTKPAENVSYLTSKKSNDIIYLLTNAHDKFEESKRKQQVNSSESLTQMPAVLLRLFSTQETSTQSTIVSDDRGEELKKTLGISGKPALSVTELEKQLLQSSSSQNQKITKPVPINDTLEKSVSTSPKSQNQAASQSISLHTVSNLQPTTLHSKPLHALDSISTNANRLMTPADFKTLRLPKSPVMLHKDSFLFQKLTNQFSSHLLEINLLDN
ncbi:unnamed protein product [Rotaria magnacalcarata]|uniref:Uncharacterized protein n=1 Tax=Rotaria magnacalcarata TaxID=392030 RepID=A0A8S2QWK4_9BILA|nr:unnamed protein product [Rotaria magnacalcarata]CAF4222248.1 unnamed protein product [Rotaria magnacalcarata]